MADLTVTAADVLAHDGATRETGTAGEAVTAGQTIYRASDGKLYKADCTTAIKARATGVALNDAAAGQPLTYAKAGGLDPGATVAVGIVYGVTDTPGGIGPIGERGPDDYITILGIAVAADRIDLAINRSEVVIPV
jgi:predicted transcriptional regulator